MFIELIATLLPVDLYLVRLLWSMQTDKSRDCTRSNAGVAG